MRTASSNMSKMLSHWMVALLIAISLSRSSCDTGCWDFETGLMFENDPPTAIGPFDWKSSEEGFLPDTHNIPSFYTTTGGYAWFQDQDTPQAAGSMASDTSGTGLITLNSGDHIQVAIWRHIIEGRENDTSRPVVRFYSNGATTIANILFSVMYDEWDSPYVTCGTTDNISLHDAQCCGGNSYPCSGYFQVDGTSVVRDELLVIDNLDLNWGCSGSTPAPTPAPTTTPAPTPAPTTTPAPTPAPTTTPAPTPAPTTTPAPTPPPGPSECCHFEQSTVCNWSLATVSDGWHWSGYLEPAVTPAIPTYLGNYIWAEDLTAPVISDEISGVTTGTTFSFAYYFTSTSGLTQDVYFAETGASTHILLGTISIPGSWLPFTATCGAGCCTTGTTCNGAVVIVSKNAPGEQNLLAIDEFSVNGGCGYIPDNWCCDFEDDPLCYWTVFYSTIGWHWTGDEYPARAIPNPSQYIWAEDETSSVTSSVLVGITQSTYFTLDYFFNPITAGSGNTLNFYFKPTGPPLPIVLLETISTSSSSWITGHTILCTAGCCLAGVRCDGLFIVESTNVPGNDEVAAIDNFSVNGACSDVTPTPPPVYCCAFDESTLCYWSPHYISTGWLWSNYTQPVLPIPPSPSGTYFIYVEDDSAAAYSPKLTGITTGTTFAVSYYFTAAVYDSSNRLEFSFQNVYGFTVVLEPDVPNTASTGAWSTYTVTCTASLNCCNGGIDPCDGAFYVTTYNAPEVDLIAAVDDFSVNGDDCLQKRFV